MIEILFQGGHGSHGPRAESLCKVTPGARAGDIALTKPSVIPGMTTLAFWGHGDSSKLCGKTATEIVSIISQWKKLNSGLKNVEIITCNARHATGSDPFANQVKSKLGFMSGTRGLTLKAMPVTVTGKQNAWSILLAEPKGSWVYITAPGVDDKMLMVANSLIQFTKNATGGLVSFKGNIAQRADEMVRANPKRQWTMNYGHMNTLRAHLVKV